MSVNLTPRKSAISGASDRKTDTFRSKELLDTMENQMRERMCPECGEEPRLVWIGFDPPEPYGEVCGCPEAAEELAWAREDKSADDAGAFDALRGDGA